MEPLIGFGSDVSVGPRPERLVGASVDKNQDVFQRLILNAQTSCLTGKPELMPPGWQIAPEKRAFTTQSDSRRTP